MDQPNSFRLTKPGHLKAGDTIAIVSPSWGGPGAFPQRYQAGKRQLEETFGVIVVEMPHTLADPDWVEHHPQARAQDLMDAFADPAIDGIIASIGGDDCVRLMPHLDLDIIKANPKVFLGFSDTTALHFACLRAGLGTFYGPSLMAGIAENTGMHGYTIEGLRKALFQTAPIGQVASNTEGWTVERLDWGSSELQSQRRKLQPAEPPRIIQGRGKVSGHLIGGCAEVLEMTKATPWWPSLETWQGAILFLETSEETPPVDNVHRWLRNYGAIGILERLNGILIGRPDPGSNPHYQGQLEATFVKVLAENDLQALPVLSGLDFGHTQPMLTLPYGVQAEIDCSTAQLTVTEAGVS
jgi:muramoyltetrapeptide carboxypeptidase LdcA involved in peptidoglycan recycling